jgi:hypothetical protein
VAGASNYVAAPSVTGATATFTNQLAAGLDYDFRITAVNSENTGLVSANYDQSTFRAYFRPELATNIQMDVTDTTETGMIVKATAPSNAHPFFEYQFEYQSTTDTSTW